MAGAPGAEVRGLAEFRADLKKLDNSSRWTKDLGKSQREIATKVAGWSRFAASGMGGPYAHFASSIVGTGGATGARVGLRGSSANTTFWGAKKRTGWYAAGKYAESTGRQHPKWVGASWDVGVSGQGPYAINPTIAAKSEQILAMYGEAVDRITAEAFSYSSSTF